MTTHFNYACFFSNGTFKIGITKQPAKRLANYVREASRFDRHVTGYWISCARDEQRARLIETTVKRVWSDCTIPRHAETFDGRKAMGHSVVRAMGLSDGEKRVQNLRQRRFHALFGKRQASTGFQRALVVVEIAESRGDQ